MSHFLNLGTHSGYILSAYGIVGLVFVYHVLAVKCQYRRICKRLKQQSHE